MTTLARTVIIIDTQAPRTGIEHLIGISVADVRVENLRRQLAVQQEEFDEAYRHGRRRRVRTVPSRSSVPIRAVLWGLLPTMCHDQSCSKHPTDTGAILSAEQIVNTLAESIPVALFSRRLIQTGQVGQLHVRSSIVSGGVVLPLLVLLYLCPLLVIQWLDHIDILGPSASDALVQQHLFTYAPRLLGLEKRRSWGRFY